MGEVEGNISLGRDNRSLKRRLDRLGWVRNSGQLVAMTVPIQP